jgi:hypothetical protein
MCHPQQLTALWASTACCRDTFTLLYFTLLYLCIIPRGEFAVQTCIILNTRDKWKKNLDNQRGLMIIRLYKSRVTEVTHRSLKLEKIKYITAAYSISALAKVRKTRGGVNRISL